MRRIIPGLVLAGCWLSLLLSGYFLLFWAVVTLISLIAGFEYLKMAFADELPFGDMVLLCSFLTLPVVMTGLWLENGLASGLFFSLFLSICYVVSNYNKLADGYTFLTRLVFGVIYIGVLVAHLLLLWHQPEGHLWLIILVAITAGSDSGAYFCGKQFGRHKLCRHVSPNKTIEGALGGLVCGIIIALVFAWILLGSFNWLMLIAIATLLTGVGIIGDLCESVVKRGTNTKDSGRILLGHGGVLDRIDSMILSAPMLYYLLLFAG